MRCLLGFQQKFAIKPEKPKNRTYTKHEQLNEVCYYSLKNPTTSRCIQFWVDREQDEATITLEQPSDKTLSGVETKKTKTTVDVARDIYKIYFKNGFTPEK